MKNILRLAALAVAFSFVAMNAHARGAVAIVNYETVPAVHASGQPASAEQVRAALQAAGPVHGWQMTAAGANRVVAMLSVRGKHSVTADISYAAGQYSIKYRDSTNMNYEPGNGAGMIHPKYNMWVQALMDDIRMQLAKQQ